MPTIISSTRNVAVIDGVQQFRIVTVCTQAGILPDTGIFVHEIKDPGDPGEDVFDRVTDIVDFDNYLNDRVAAVARGDSYWRSYVLTKFYTDVQVANSAKTAIQDRVDELASDYDTYYNDFQATSESTELPTGAETLLNSLNSAYNSAYAAYESAVSAEETAESAKSTADSAYTAAKTRLESLQGVFDSASARKIEMAQAYSGMVAFRDSSEDIISAIDLFNQEYETSGSGVDAEVDTLMGSRDQFNLDRNTFVPATNDAGVGVDNHDALVTLVQALVNDASASVTTAEDDVRTTTQALAEAEAATAAAYTALEAAYDNAKSACSTWTPDSGKEFPPAP